MDCNFMTFHEAMLSCASGMEPMQLFTAIQGNNNLAALEQINGGHEVVTLMLLPEIPSEANLSSSQGTRAIPEGEVARLPDSVNVVDAVEFLLSFLEQEIPISPSPSQNKIWVKKMFHKIAQELKVLSPGNPSIIRNDNFDIMSDWKSYVEELIKELRIVQRKCSLDARNSGVYVFTKTLYALILEMIAENLIG